MRNHRTLDRNRAVILFLRASELESSSAALRLFAVLLVSIHYLMSQV
jgi:hypothetical protein